MRLCVTSLTNIPLLPVLQIDPNGWNAAGGGTNSLSPGITGAAGWGLEAILTMTLVFVVYAAVDAERGANTAHLPVCAQQSVVHESMHAYHYLMHPT
jgi:hypothetical protein